MSIGFRVLQRRRVVDPSVVNQFKELPVANVSDVMGRMTAGGARLRPLHAAGNLAGPALTVKARPGDNLMAHMALAMAQPGDVIVVDVIRSDCATSLDSARSPRNRVHLRAQRQPHQNRGTRWRALHGR